MVQKGQAYVYLVMPVNDSGRGGGMQLAVSSGLLYVKSGLVSRAGKRNGEGLDSASVGAKRSSEETHNQLSIDTQHHVIQA